jgi:hypothetical protein
MLLIGALEKGAAPVKAAANHALTQLRIACHHLATLRAAPDSKAAAAIEQLIAPRAELEDAVQLLSRSKDRLLAAEIKTFGPLWAESAESWIQRLTAEKLAAQVDEGRRARSELRRRAAAYHAQHPGAALTGPNPDYPYEQLAAVLRVLPEDRAYRDKELTRLLARHCGGGVWGDYALTRRRLADEGWLSRTKDEYRLTPAGRRAWRIERMLAAKCTGGLGMSTGPV